MKISADIDISSLARQIKKVGKRFGDTQEQANKRWGVNAAKNLALVTQPFGKGVGRQRKAMRGDSFRVVIPATNVKKTANGYSYKNYKGNRGYVKANKFTKNPQEIVLWIDGNRNNKGRTKKLPPQDRMVCSTQTLAKANTMRGKRAGFAKDGYLDAGEHIARGQKGRIKAKMGDYMKTSKQSEILGRSRRRRKNLTTISEIINNVSYIGSVIDMKDIKKAVHDTGMRTLKWYKYTMRAEAKKKRTR